MDTPKKVIGATSITLNMQGVLLCPVCGGDYLHHQTTEIFERVSGEDSACMRVIVNSAFDVQQLLIPPKETQGRRHYVLMSYNCEWCEQEEGSEVNVPYKLRIQQHKGNTYLEWIKESNS